jgi:TPR repeat protein
MNELGQGVPKDVARATELYRAACDASHASGGCNRLGLAFSRGRGVAKDAARATALFESGCDARDWAACTNLAVDLEQSGEAVRAKDLFDRACKAGRAKRVIRADDMTACLDLGILVRASDPRTAIELFGASCDAGLDKACGRLGLMLVEGRGVATDATRGAKLLEKACDGGDGSACNNLGRSYYKGIGVTADRDRAQSLWKKACTLGDQAGCSNAEREARSH